MNRTDEINTEIRRLIARFRPLTHADFEIPRMVYAQIIADNTTRKQPYRVGYNRIEQLMHEIYVNC